MQRTLSSAHGRKDTPHRPPHQLALFAKWAALQTDWKKEIASGNVRWQQAFAAHPAKALAAAESFLAQTPPAAVRPCNGKLVNV